MEWNADFIIVTSQEQRRPSFTCWLRQNGGSTTISIGSPANNSVRNPISRPNSLINTLYRVTPIRHTNAGLKEMRIKREIVASML